MQIRLFPCDHIAIFIRQPEFLFLRGSPKESYGSTTNAVPTNATDATDAANASAATDAENAANAANATNASNGCRTNGPRCPNGSIPDSSTSQLVCSAKTYDETTGTPDDGP